MTEIPAEAPATSPGLADGAALLLARLEAESAAPGERAAPEALPAQGHALVRICAFKLLKRRD
ncbi:hypothetical protein [Rubrimonas cliftonensis]|uniref:Uncharacterized protein n=1 Tax=Rubrimonas cliftonensis TaxID=89524 RepID=A0A1H4CJS8_9RHOB|nr:hypothetical protein [Rubrimonas cliftonensis]SEA60563.1 hypothetical protein SAMN05444370_107106 [Rubrimonas cliftonensis]